MFRDRTHAGERLAALLDDHDVEADVVLAVPRGGLPVGRVVADALGVPLDVVAARKIGTPGNPELAIGAVASDGTLWLNEPYIGSLAVSDDYVEDAIESERALASEKLKRYRENRPPLDLREKAVVVVDDGVATGATTIACLRQVRDAGASQIILAVPVGSPGTIERLRSEADEVLCVETPPYFDTVGQFYQSFPQVSDEEAMTYLESAPDE